MKVEDVRGGREQTIELLAEGGFGVGPKQGEEAVLVLAGTDVVLGVGGQEWAVRGANGPSRRALAEVTGAGLPCLAWVAATGAARVVLHVRQFPAVLRVPERITVRVDDATCEEARRVMGFGGTPTEVPRWLGEALLLGPGTGDDAEVRRAVVSAGTGVGAMRVYGPKMAVDLASRDGALAVDRIVKGAARIHDTARLLVAPIAFVDASLSGALAASTRAALDAAVRASGSYLEIWRHYALAERKQVEARAAEFGVIRYTDRERSGAQWRVTLGSDADRDERFEGLTGDACFELSTARPEPARDADDEEEVEARRRPPTDAVVLRFVRRNNDALVLEPLDEEDVKSPPPSGWLRLSVVGDLKRIERRETAEQRLREGSGPMPQLGLILEGQPAPSTRYKHREAMSAAARQAFGRGPTARQEEAVDIAVNASDIVMIQGPPGTGKTSVITAIQRRVAELDEDSSVRHRMLVTSAQHDAVENVVARSKVFGLPAVKIGVRRGGDGAGLDGAAQFQADQAEKVRATLESETESERLRIAREHIVTLLAQPGTAAQNAQALSAVRTAIEGLVPPALLDEVAAREKALRAGRSPDDEERTLLRRAALGLPCSATQFEDGGARAAARALQRLDAMLTDDERALLTRCARWDGDTAPPWISELERVRDALVDRLQPQSVGYEARLDEETRALLVRLAEAMREGLGTRRTQEESVVANFLHDLESDPAGVRDTLEEYTAVLAATLQHSAAKSMREARGIDTGNMEFDSVLVDEAARAHPLDLFIPISMGRRRIVLVGDHRQLPHMLEPEVERAILAGDLSAETERALKESLFQRLWDLMKAREKQDGVVRTVTLDQQFRMHPVLGGFVSRCFYEAKGDPPIRSPRPAGDFPHGLKQFMGAEQSERVAAWVDVPRALGAERGKPSPSRRCEARRVARLAHSILQADPSLSVGVISFYRGQVDEIATALGDVGVMEKSGGAWEVRSEWRVGRGRDGESIERFRLGTVDAFQGKEFDVVILSVTRSNGLPATTDVERRRKYGHLLLDNRLCVAMSRQRRLLVAVGDLNFVRVAEALPALRGFVQLCEGPDGLILE